MPVAPKVRDQYAELYVAGILSDGGWDIYFPRRDKGFDMIAAKALKNRVVVRPIQVKGLYPSSEKKDKSAYGYIGKLSLLHDDMILALVYFSPSSEINPYIAPAHIAWMPKEQIKKQASKGYKCQPAMIKSGFVKPRRDFRIFFDKSGMEKLLY